MMDSGAVSTDITDGAKRLAQELDQYITTGSKVSTPASGNDLSLSHDAIADLQLATARKLREVRSWNVQTFLPLPLFLFLLLLLLYAEDFSVNSSAFLFSLNPIQSSCSPTIGISFFSLRNGIGFLFC
jgi:hypothetical protein